MKNKLSLFLKKLHKITKVRIIFFIPQNVETVILDYQTGYFYKKIFKNKIILHTRGEKYYLKILIYSILQWFLVKRTLNQIYIINCIKIINPKYLITFTDYNLFFLSLKKIFPKKKLIIFQSHTRSFQTLVETIGPRYNKFKKFEVDYIFMWGKRFKDYYDYLLNGKKIISGNIKNNLFKKKKKLKSEKTLVLISQFRVNKIAEFHFNDKKTERFLKDFYDNLRKYIEQKKIKLLIIGNKLNKKEALAEELFFFKMLGNEFIFLKKKDIFDSYIYSQKFNNFITNSSSLGLELIARGKRVCFINRESPYKDKFKEDIFKIRKKGVNWVNSSDKKSVFKVLDFMIFSNNNFKNIYKKYFEQFLIHDEKNGIIKSELKKIGLIF